MFLRAFLLTLCVVTGHMETMGWPSICWRPKLRGNCSCHFQGHPTLWGYWWRAYSTWQRGYTASWWIRMPYRFWWILWRLCLPRFPWRMLGLVVKEQHSLCRTGHRRAGLWWVQRYLPHALSHCCGMCSLSSHSFPFFCFALLHMMIFKWNTYVRLALLLVLLLTLLIYLGQSTPTVLMTSLGSMWWVATKMSWVTLFLWVHERWVLFHSLPYPSFFFSYIPQ